MGNSFVFVVLPLLCCLSMVCGQLQSSQTYTLFRIRQQLEFPPVIKSWNRQTNFCSLPPTPSLTIVCTQDRITELTIVGSKRPATSRKSFAVSSNTLSSNFSIDSLISTVTKISSLEVLSLVSLGIWGELPSKVKRLSSLRVLNLSSNYIYGQLPGKISSLSNLQNLVLSDNLLNGSVPDLTGMKALQELDMANNLLGPNFQALPNNLVSVNLHSNKLSSNIPLSFASFNRIQRLDLSSNQLTGPLLPALFSLPVIQYLNMARNKLSGSLPMSGTCNQKLKYIDVTDNLLIGILPSCISSNTSNKVVLYSGNCLSSKNSAYQHPFSFCNKDGAFAADPTTTNKRRASKGNLGVVIGICAAVVGGLLIMGTLLWLIFRKFSGKNGDEHLGNTSLIEKATSRNSINVLAAPRNAKGGMRMGAMGMPSYHIFTMEELEEVTSNFEEFNLIEDGPDGKLYKGWSMDGSQVAVRIIELKQNYSSQSLQHCAETFPKLRHQNLVSILGHYIDNKNIFIVVENVSNGTLRSLLADPKRVVPRWPQRVAAAIGVAKGLQFLHREVSPGIFGNDLKSDKILLDDNLSVKISGYNLPLPLKHKFAKVGSESPLGEGPNDLLSNEEGQKGDMYQLGVILLELISGNPITSDNELKALKQKMEKSVTDAPRKLRAAMDPSLRGTYSYDSVRTVAEIALNCLSEDISKRPSVEDVLWNLQYSVQVQDGWANSGHLSRSFSNISDGFNN